MTTKATQLGVGGGCLPQSTILFKSIPLPFTCALCFLSLLILVWSDMQYVQEAAHNHSVRSVVFVFNSEIYSLYLRIKCGDNALDCQLSFKYCVIQKWLTVSLLIQCLLLFRLALSFLSGACLMPAFE